MARKRIIDPTFWEDEEIGLKWPPLARLFYIGLWNFADDEGRIKAHPALLKSQIFPYERRIDIERLKKEVSGKVQWYEVNNSQYGYIRNFLKHQRIDRPTPTKLPPPPQIGEPSASPQRDVLPNIREVNIREVNISSFNKLYTKYPKKVGKKEAERHFKASVKTSEDLANINIALDNYLASERVAKGFTQNASTWFNNWQDWIDYTEPICPKCKNKGNYENERGYRGNCDCPAGKRLEKEG